MIRRSARICLEVVIALVALATIAVGVTVWRLSSGPVQLSFLSPVLETAIQDLESGLSLDVGETEVTWSEGGRTLDFRALEIEVRDGDGASLAVLPQVDLQLSLRALVQGRLAPTRIRVAGARVVLVRDADGRFELAGLADLPAPQAGQAPREADFTHLIPSILRRLLSEPDLSHPLTFLQTARIVDGRLTVIDRRLGTVWQAPSANIEVRREAAGLSGDVRLGVKLREQRAKLDLAFLYDKSTTVIDLAAKVSGLRPDALAEVASGLDVLSAVSVPLSGKVAASLKVDGTIHAVSFDLSGGPGAITLSGLFESAHPLRSIDLRGSFASASDRLTIEAADLQLGSAERPGPTLSITGTLDGLHGDMAIEAEARVDRMSADELGHYWPEGLAKGGRRWMLKNVRGGAASAAVLRFAAVLPDGERDKMQVTRLDGGFEYQDIDVHFLRPMPPVTGVSGTATFDGGSLRLEVAGGALGELRASASKVVISNLDKHMKEKIDIDLAIGGPLRRGLELLDHDRLKLIRRLNLDPAAAAGQASARIGFRFPLLRDLTFDHIAVSATADLQDVVVEDIALGATATQGRLALELNNDAMRLRGPMALGGVPMDLDWREDFTDGAEPRSLIEATVPRIDDAGRRSLGLDVVPGLTGPISAVVVARLNKGRRGQVEGELDLGPADLDLPFLYWRKPAGVEGRGSFVLSMLGGRVTALDSLSVETDDLRLQGGLRFDQAGREFTSVRLDELLFNDSALTNVSVEREGDVLVIALGGGTLDAGPFIKADGAVPEDGAPATPIRLSAPKLQTIHFAEGRFLEDSRLELRRGPRGLEKLLVSGRVPRALWSAAGDSGAEEPKSMTLDYHPVAQGDYRLSITANDLGSVLRTFNVMDAVRGGDLEITGTSDGPALTRPLALRIEATDYTLVNAPIMTRLLTVASFTGLLDLLTGEGVQFDRLEGDVVLEKGIATTELLRAYGSALGLTAKGWIDFNQSKLQVKGTIVPAYTVNRILGAIPLLNRILVGGEGEGLLAVTYEISGPLDDPKVSANPLALLAPGFLRGLFGIFDGEDGDTDAANRRDLQAIPDRIER